MDKKLLDSLRKDGFGNWFAGFVDGEGSFYMMNATNGRYTVPAFAICLRLDDMDVISEIRDRLGVGKIYAYNYNRNSSPMVQFRVVAKADLAKLVVLFDRFPLRSKKIRDFEIWKLAVEEYLKPTRNTQKMRALKEALTKSHGYNGEVEMPAEKGDEQLELW